MSGNYRDIFEPHCEPARSIYLAFQREAAKRGGRGIGEWMQAEREAVFREAEKQAHELGHMGLRCPTMDEVIAAERYASGSINYGAKWAYGVVGYMRREVK
jgi:hypothetical protein